MNKENSTISKVESYFDSILPKTLADKIFFGNLPKVIDDSWGTVALVECGNIIQRDAYAFGNVLVFLFARPFANGRKDVATLSAMEQALISAVEEAKCDGYALRMGSTYQDYDTNRNLHCSIFNIEVTIS